MSHFWKQRSEVNSTYIKTPSLPQAREGITQLSPVLLSENAGGCVVPFESDHCITTADVSMFTQLEEAPFLRGQAFCSSRSLYYSLRASTRHSRFCFWTGFRAICLEENHQQQLHHDPHNHKAHLQREPQLCHVTAQSRAEWPLKKQASLKNCAVMGMVFIHGRWAVLKLDTVTFFYNKKLAHPRFQNRGLGV